MEMFAIVYLVSNELIQNKQNTSTVTRDKTQRRRTHSDRGATSPDCVKHRHQRERVAVTAPPMAHLPPVSRDLLLLHNPLQHTFTVAGSCCYSLSLQVYGENSGRQSVAPDSGVHLRNLIFLNRTEAPVAVGLAFILICLIIECSILKQI